MYAEDIKTLFKQYIEAVIPLTAEESGYVFSFFKKIGTETPITDTGRKSLA